MVDFFPIRRQRAVAIALVVDAAAMAVHLQIFLQGLQAVCTVGPYPAIVLARSQHLTRNLAAAGRCRRGLVVAHQFILAIHRHVVLATKVVHPVLLRPYRIHLLLLQLA